MPLPRAPRLPGLYPFYDSRRSNIFAAFRGLAKLVVRTAATPLRRFTTPHDTFMTFTMSLRFYDAFTTFTMPLLPLRRLDYHYDAFTTTDVTL